jgi:arylsulfatase B
MNSIVKGYIFVSSTLVLIFTMIKKLFILIIAIAISAKLYAQQNTLLIIADDVSPDYFGSFSTTNDTAVAPNIRTLANKSVRFSKVWASPVCSPTRAGIFTGRYSFRTGVGQVITSGTSPQIDTAEMSIAKLLKWYAPTKYNTACVGKWHLNNNAPIKRLFPNKMGYDFYAGNFNGALTDYYNWTRIKNGIQDTVANYSTTQNINDAISWLDTINTNNPFFLWLAFNAPHSPYHLPPANLCNTAGLSGTAADIAANPKKYFKASIEAMDTEIGRLLQYLSANNLLDSTNIIFMGDNGNANAVAQIANPNKAKATIYNYGVHVPFFVTGPAVVNANRDSEELINTPDLFATIAELCGFVNWKSAIPSSTIVDSKSIVPILKNTNTALRTWIFSEQFNAPTIAVDGKTMRNKDYHLLRFDNGVEELYNQTLDVEENNNLLLSSMSNTDIFNYHFLCDSMASLTGIGNCLSLSTRDMALPKPIIAPNPFHDYILVTNIGANDYCTLWNIFGSKIYSGTNIANQNLSALPIGLYFLLVNNSCFKLRKE